MQLILWLLQTDLAITNKSENLSKFVTYIVKQILVFMLNLANRECDSHNVCAVYDDTCLLQLKQMLAGVIGELY